MRERIIFGMLLALGVVGGLYVDVRLSLAQSPVWEFWGIPVGHWLYHGFATTVILIVFTALGVHELMALARQMGYRPLRVETHIFAQGLVLGPWISHNLPPESTGFDQSWGMFWLALFLFVTFASQALRRGTERVMVNISTSMFIVFYAGGLAGYMVKLRMAIGGAEGVVLLLYSVFLVKMNDVGAYFTGRFLGKHKLIPWLSPKKTWEGLAGGIATTVAMSILVGWLILGNDWAPKHADVLRSVGLLATFGLVMAFFSIAGDLYESLLKRDADVKDSGQVFPGLGGVLDVIDSPLLAAPAAWFFWTQVVATWR